MYETSCHGFNLASDLPLPLPAGTLPGAPLRTIALAELPPWPQLPHRQKTASWGVVDQTLRVQWGKVQFQIDDGGIKIGGDLRGIDPGDWAVRVAMGFAVQRDSRVAFHGSAVGNAGAVLVVGDKGAGKSTTAWGLAARGWKPLGDDCAVLSDDGLVWPGACRFRLCADVCTPLRLTPGKPDTEGKFSFEPGARGGPTPLAALVVLKIGEGPQPTARLVSGYRKLEALFPHLQSPQGVGDPLVRHRRLLALAHVPVFEIHRPATRFALEEVLDLIESLVRSPV